MASNKIVVAFDLYGTLLSTESIAKQLATFVGEDKASSISTTWRKYQLEYTWRLNSMGGSLDLFSITGLLGLKMNFLGTFDSFSNITKNSLLHALAENEVKLQEEDIQRVMAAYDSLSTFADVEPALTKIASNPHITAVVFSNGTKTMVSNSVYHSQDLSPQAKVFQHIITVDDVKKYKPAPDTYLHLADRVGKDRSQTNEMWLVSGNPFDIIGSRSVGMKAAWVDRANRGWQDAAVPDLQPIIIATNLDNIVNAIEQHCTQKQQ
jgi:2-haloacid dehalogenase